MTQKTRTARRRLGKSDLTVSPIGLGCMPLSGVYGPADDAASEALIRHALDRGVNHLDTSDVYGWGHNETLVGRAIKGRRNEVVLATKFGHIRRDGQPNGVDGRPEYVQQACDASLARLGIEVIDLYISTAWMRRCPLRRRLVRWRSSSSRERCVSSVYLRRIPTASAVLMRCIGLRRSRPNSRCSIAKKPRRPAEPRRSLVSASSPIHLWAAAFLPARSARLTTSMAVAPHIRAFRARI